MSTHHCIVCRPVEQFEIKQVHLRPRACLCQSLFCFALKALPLISGSDIRLA